MLGSAPLSTYPLASLGRSTVLMSATLSASSRSYESLQAKLTGSAALSAVADLSRDIQAQLHGYGTLSGATKATLAAKANLTGVGVLEAPPIIHHHVVLTLTGFGTASGQLRTVMRVGATLGGKARVAVADPWVINPVAARMLGSGSVRANAVRIPKGATTVASGVLRPSERRPTLLT